MKWKITLRFMLAVLAVSIISSFVNLLISLYFSYEQYSTTQVFNGIFSVATFSSNTSESYSATDAENVAVTVKTDDHIRINDFSNGELSFSITDRNSGEMIIIAQNIVESITDENGWIQVINSTGEEIGSFNKPNEVKRTYTLTEIEKAAENPMKMDNYYVMTVSDMLTDGPNQGEKMTYVIGVPRPDFDLKTIVDYNLNYFMALDTQKAVSIVVTLLVALILGYLLAVRLNRPVVKMTDGITAMAGGNYDVDFPKDSFYKDVYESLKQMATNLKAGELERKKTERMREEWITNISHDLKTPLSSIKGYGELLYESGQELTHEDLQKYIGVVLEKSAYMDALINDLKLTQKLKNEAFPLKKTAGNLVELLRDTVIGILNDPHYESRHIHFDTETEDICFEYDPHLFKRAFINLVMNAVVHNQEDTEIWVRIRQEDKIIVEINDNGKGIEQAEQEKLFERYYRGTSTNDSYDGSGLGLVIAREIIQAHGGCISLKSSIGEGTTVRVVF